MSSYCRGSDRTGLPRAGPPFLGCRQHLEALHTLTSAPTLPHLPLPRGSLCPKYAVPVATC